MTINDDIIYQFMNVDVAYLTANKKSFVTVTTVMHSIKIRNKIKSHISVFRVTKTTPKIISLAICEKYFDCTCQQ